MSSPIVLSRNECPYPPSPLVVEYLNKHVDKVNRYEVPGLVEQVVERVSSYSGVRRERVELLLGSEELFSLLPWYMYKHKCKFIYFSPTFEPAVEDLAAWDLELVDLELDESYSIDLERAKRACDDRSVVYVVRPNNPTGNLTIDCSGIAELASRSRLVIVDEAYYEFSRETCVELVEELDNVVVLRTLSKAFCLAGARIGYMISSPETIREIVSARRKYSIPIPTLLAGLGALSDLKYLERVVSEILRTKEAVLGELRERRGVEAINTLTNFILVAKEGYDSRALHEKLLERGILVKPLSGRLSKYVRVSIGRADEMEKFAEAVLKI